MKYVGVDIVEIARIDRAIARWGERFLRRVYTEPELSSYRGKSSSLAARFAGKEAVVKSLGNQTGGIGWRDIEILSDPDGRPLVCLYGRAQEQADLLGLKGFAISLSHSREYAVAFVVGESADL
jgi:holo-[acyl-carrier protein] synthase